MSALLSVTQDRNLQKCLYWKIGSWHAIAARAFQTVRNSRVRWEMGCPSKTLPVRAKSLLYPLSCLHHLVRHINMPNEPFPSRPIAILIVFQPCHFTHQ
jgi:hypothetical protein